MTQDPKRYERISKEKLCFSLFFGQESSKDNKRQRRKVSIVIKDTEPEKNEEKVTETHFKK